MKVAGMVLLVTVMVVVVVLTVDEEGHRGGERRRDVVVGGAAGEVRLHIVPREGRDTELRTDLTLAGGGRRRGGEGSEGRPVVPCGEAVVGEQR